MQTELSVQSRFAYPNSFPLLPPSSAWLCISGETAFISIPGKLVLSQSGWPNPPCQRLVSEWVPVIILTNWTWRKVAWWPCRQILKRQLLFSWQLFYLDEMPEEVASIAAIFAQGRQPEPEVTCWRWQNKMGKQPGPWCHCWTDIFSSLGTVGLWTSY